MGPLGDTTCLVAKGFTHKCDLDFEETFALVARLSSICTLLVAATSRQWNLFQICQLCHAFYGFKQGPRGRFAKFSSMISRLCYSISSYDYAIFLRHTSKCTILLILYVVDIIIIGYDLSGIQE